MKLALKILTVDDDFINLKLLSSMLKNYPNVETVLEAKNGLDAITILNDNPDTHLILLDIKMPIMDGMDFLGHKESQPKLKHIPVIVLTTDETKKHEAFERGAYDFLSKPIRKNLLFEKLDKVINLLQINP